MNRYLVLDLYNKKDAMFFGEKFLKDSTEWAKKITKHEEELKDITELSAMTNSEVHSGNIGHPTEKTAFERMRIESSIHRYEVYQQIFNHGMAALDEEQKKIINSFFFTPGKYVHALVSSLADELGCSLRGVYRKKDKAILDFVAAVMEYINY